MLDRVEHYTFTRATRKNRLEAFFSLQGGGELGEFLRRPLLGRIKRGGVNHDISIAGRETKASAPLFPPGFMLLAHLDPRARDFLTGQAEVKECTSLMLGSVDSRLTQDEAGVGDQDLVVT